MTKNPENTPKITKNNTKFLGFPRVSCGPVEPCGALWSPLCKAGPLAPKTWASSISQGANFLILEKNLDKIVPIPNYDVVIYIVEDHHDSNFLYNVVDNYNLQYLDYKFLSDAKNEDTFINGVQSNNGKYNLVLAQPRKDLLLARKKLAKTNYYDNYDENYLKEVLEEDYDNIKQEINSKCK